MAFEEIVFPLDKSYKGFERDVGKFAALRAEVEILRSVYMEMGPKERDKIKKLEAIARKRDVKKET